MDEMGFCDLRDDSRNWEASVRVGAAGGLQSTNKAHIVLHIQGPHSHDNIATLAVAREAHATEPARTQ